MSAITSSTANVAAPTLPDSAFRLHAKNAKDQAQAAANGQVPAGEATSGLFSSILQAVGMFAKL